jgi:hypothetical protein
MCVEGQKLRPRHDGDLRRVLQVEEDEPGSLVIVFAKIGCLRLQVGDSMALGKLGALIAAWPGSTGIETSSKQRMERLRDDSLVLPLRLGQFLLRKVLICPQGSLLKAHGDR